MDVDERAQEGEVRLWRAQFVAMIRMLNEIEGDIKPVVDLTLIDLGILFSLNGTGPQPMGSLAALFGVDPSVITYRVRRLEEMGDVERGQSAADGRVVEARITRRGKRSLGKGRTALLHAARDHFFVYVDPLHIPLLTTIFEGVLAKQPTIADSEAGETAPSIA